MDTQFSSGTCPGIRLDEANGNDGGTLWCTSRNYFRAHQVLKDRNSKGMTMCPRARPRPESESSTEVRWVSGATEPMKKASVGKKGREREAEKAEIAMHLICCGPR
ncbi:unnamed protein product [Dovyalis caffra]|uniref:Uncharacterized protein n=1 Tax=Dovyalis caffra TaxID=77055 RepID=A0AAV1SI70_9ROSI|nr:unnamed protein product [Dovyalis caffra]